MYVPVVGFLLLLAHCRLHWFVILFVLPQVYVHAVSLYIYVAS